MKFGKTLKQKQELKEVEAKYHEEWAKTKILSMLNGEVRFALLPKRMDCGRLVWLEKYLFMYTPQRAYSLDDARRVWRVRENATNKDWHVYGGFITYAEIYDNYCSPTYGWIYWGCIKRIAIEK